MTKIEITDAMVDRALKAGDLMWSQELVRTMLDAALNPPPEPDVLVTEEMEIAGLSAYYETSPDQYFKRYSAHISMNRAFRAMRALEPKPERPVWTKVDQPPERGPGYRFHARSHDVGYPHSHRRAGDLK